MTTKPATPAISPDETTMRSIAAALAGKKRVLVTTHLNADGDAVGSASAFAYLAEYFGSDVRMLFASGLPEYLAWLPRPCSWVRTPEELGDWAPDLLVMTDCGDARRAGPVLEAFLTRGIAPVTGWERTESLNIDHHTGNPAFASYNWVRPESAATGLMVGMLGEYMGMPLTGNFALAVYTALVDDTGNFSFANTNAECFALAERIVRNGLNVGEFTDRYENNWNLDRMHLWGRLMEEISVHADGKIASCIVPRSYLTDKGLHRSSLEGFAAWLRKLKGVRVGVFIREDGPDICKISLRSHDLDVRPVAVLFHGGGHPNAAGAEVEGIPPGEVQRLVIAEVEKLLG